MVQRGHSLFHQTEVSTLQCHIAMFKSSEQEDVTVLKSTQFKPWAKGRDWEIMTVSGDLITNLDFSSLDYPD